PRPPADGPSGIRSTTRGAEHRLRSNPDRGTTMRTETQALPNTRKPRDDEIDVHGLTHPGRVRSENQDHFLLATVHKRVNVIATNLGTEAQLPAREQRVAFIAVVADGVGGAHGGAEAG